MTTTETSAGLFPTDAAERKKLPLGTGVLDYFPDALIEVARVSFIGNQQHNPGEPLHWAKEKSQDEPDTIVRHFLERFNDDTDGTMHAAKMVWRGLAFLQKLIEARRKGMTYAEYNKFIRDNAAKPTIGGCVSSAPAGAIRKST